jgi:hypothetical protein
MEIPKQSFLSLVPAVLSDSGEKLSSVYSACTQCVPSVCSAYPVHVYILCTYCVQSMSGVCPLCELGVYYMPTVCNACLLYSVHAQYMQCVSAFCLLCSGMSSVFLCACLVLEMSLWSMYHPIGCQASHAVFIKEVFGLLGDMNDCPQVLSRVSCCPVPQCQNLLPLLWDEYGR